MQMLMTVVVLTVIFYNAVAALECYVCDSNVNGNACKDPLDRDEVKSQTCTEISTTNTNSNGNQNPNWNQPPGYPQRPPPWNQMPNSNQNPTWIQNPNSNRVIREFECVHYEKHFSGGNSQVIRQCQQRGKTTCSVLQHTSGVEGYTLTFCKVCTTDYCNYSSKIRECFFLILISLLYTLRRT